MSYFDNILKIRGLEECPLPLWKLKITEEEFEELRVLLEKRTHVEKDPFDCVCREAALFFAEYWRRRYDDGAHSKEMVYRDLGSGSTSSRCEEFYKAAKIGAKNLKIERYQGRKRRYLDEMLYQGGLPMRLVTGESSNLTTWDRFTRGLVNKRISFNGLNLGEVAAQSQSMEDFCNQLISGIEKQDYKELPFYCKDENDKWYLFLNDLASQEKRNRRQRDPFNLTFEFDVDHIDNKINVKYVFEGEQKFPKNYIESRGLNGVNFFTLQIRKNGQAVRTFEFINNFCRNRVNGRGSYNEGDNITVFLHNQDEPIKCEELDMDVPHLLYKKDNKYILGNHIGKDESLLLIPKGWEVQNEDNYSINVYKWGEKPLRVIKIKVDFSGEIKVKGVDGEITFGAKTALYWTEILGTHLCMDNIIEPVYNVKKCRFTLCCDSEDDETRRTRVQYRNKRQSEWSDNSSYGEIFVRAEEANGHYVTPIRLINVGKGIAIKVIKADADSCKLSVSWCHGDVSTEEGKLEEGKLEEGKVWLVNKSDCQDHRRIRFLFTPKDNPENRFYLSIKAPFKNFSIIDDINDVDITKTNNCRIPYSDVDRYHYHLVGQDVEYSYGNVSRKLRWLEGKLYICDNNGRETIPYEGSLVTLFGSRETLRSLLDRTSKNIVDAEVKVEFTMGDRNNIRISIKDFPFRVRPEGNIVFIENYQPVKYTGRLKLLKLADPQTEAIEIRYDKEAECYRLPEDIRSWGKTILIGNSEGRILPKLVDLTQNMSEYEDTNAAIRQELGEAKIGDDFWQRVIGWFDLAQKEGIPASSIFELKCTANSPKALLCLAFQLYVKYRDDVARVSLTDKLKTFSNDLAFQWYWLKPYLANIGCLLNSFMSEDDSQSVIKEMYLFWALSREGEDRMKYLEALSDNEAFQEYIVNCLNDVWMQFKTWMEDLCVSSLLERYDHQENEIVNEVAKAIIRPQELSQIEVDTDEEYIDEQQGDLGEVVSNFFSKYDEQGNHSNTEKWLLQRVNAVVNHLNGQVDLFSQNEEIRRSIIYCIKSNNYRFVIELYRKLKNRFQ